MSVVAAASGPSTYWYLTRSTGAMAMVLLTATVALGVLDVKRLSTPEWPRFVVDSLHRNLALLTLVFLVVHILTSVLDSFAPISLTAAVIPFISAYRPFWLGLGAVAFDMLLAVTITSLLRRRLGHLRWRQVHWLSYACWPIALLHGFGTGSDVKSAWLQVLSLACIAVVLAGVLVRVASGWPSRLGLRSAALAVTGGFSLFLLLWLPSGPLGSDWARRSGTPAALLHSASAPTSHKAER
ncbi:MAG: ferric reductase-like transmembrane domain-containing protein [Solirubrobacteraceae bacterium]